MARSVAFYLTRFDEPSVIVAPEPEFFVAETPEEPELVLEEPKPEIAEEMREQLLEEGRAAAKAEYDELTARERAGFVLRIENERRRWAREEGERLADEFRAALDQFAARVGDDVGRVLEPFVTREVRAQMLESLLQGLRAVIADRDEPVVHLSGPADLLEMVCEKLNGEGVATRVEDADGVDVRARIESTTIETRLEDWMRELRDEDDPA